MALHEIAIVWRDAPRSGRLEVLHGRLRSVKVVAGHGGCQADAFYFDKRGSGRIVCQIDADRDGPGAQPTMLTIRADDHAFSLFLRDVAHVGPINLTRYGVAITPADDTRDYNAIENARRSLHRLTDLQRIDVEPEHSLEVAETQMRQLTSPTWLGISRDVRVFEVGLRQPMVYSDWVRPRFHGHGYFPPAGPYTRSRYGYVAGRGWGCTDRVRRWMEDGELPILHTERIDGDLRYEATIVAALEHNPLCANNIRGTHHRVADGLSACNALTPEQQRQFDALATDALDGGEQTVCRGRIVATNIGRAPRYAFFKALHPHTETFGHPDIHHHDSATGFGRHQDDDNVFGVSLLNGEPMAPEAAVLLKPGATCVFEFALPHRPIPADRAAHLAQRDFDADLHASGAFWRQKLEDAGQVHLPERRIEQLWRQGRVHLETFLYGTEPDAPLMAGNGVYGMVGFETVPLLNWLDSLGRHDMVRRTINFYFDKQRDDGFLQTFANYHSETGCLLWLLSEHLRYTRDDVWARSVADRVVKTCDHLITLRRQRREADPSGLGLLTGQVADPPDADERLFQINGYAYLGLSRGAELLEAIEHPQAARVRQEADALKSDIRAALVEAMAQGPAVPLADGSWCPSIGPWLGSIGPRCLSVEEADCAKAHYYGGVWSHGTITIRDDQLGPLPLVCMEVLEPDDPMTDIMLDFYAALFFDEHVSFSQPLLGRHPLIHLARREPKAFLKAYYNQIAALMDRQTHTCWEHFYHVSPNSTGDEAQLLMQTRQMLYREESDTLALLRGVPDAWLKHGQTIALNGVASYFGPLTLRVESHIKAGSITASIRCPGDRRPARIELRLPHPDHLSPVRVEGGRYDAELGCVIIEPFSGSAEVTTHYAAPTRSRRLNPTRRSHRMRINMAIIWDRAPARLRVEAEDGELYRSTTLVGWGDSDPDHHTFTFTSAGDPCHLCFAIDTPDGDPQDLPTKVRVLDTDDPFEFMLKDVFAQPDAAMRIDSHHVRVHAEVDRLACL